jgi:hypothetical protein
MADLPSYPGAPRWVKVSAIVVAVLVLLGVAMIVTGVGGPHGPWRHMSGNDIPPAGVTEGTRGGQAPLEAGNR